MIPFEVILLYANMGHPAPTARARSFGGARAAIHPALTAQTEQSGQEADCALQPRCARLKPIEPGWEPV